MGNSSSSDGAGAVSSQPGFTPLTTKRPGTVRVKRLASANDAAAAPLAPPLSPIAETSVIPAISPPGSFKDEPGLTASGHQAAAASEAASAQPSASAEAKVGAAKSGAGGVVSQPQGQVYGAAYPPEMIAEMMQQEALKRGSSGIRRGGAPADASREAPAPAPEPAPAGAAGAAGAEEAAEEGEGEESVRQEREGAREGREPASGGGGAEEGGGGGGVVDVKRQRQREKFVAVLSGEVADLNRLRTLCWAGCDEEHRPDTWRLLLRYMPGNKGRREEKMAGLREEYADAVANYFDKYNPDSADEYDRVMYNQIAVDLPRTNPSMPLFQSPRVHASLHRILYLWAIRHPGTGYVQGINDLVTPFFFVFLREATHCQHDDATIASGRLLHTLSPDTLAHVEADCYHCLTNMLDNAQDNYVVDFKGIQEKVFRLKRIIRRLDDALVAHLDHHNVDFIQFAFRWFNCLLMRELSMACTLRLWDAYVADKQFAAFHVYVCAAVLLAFADDLKAMDFQDMIMFLQKLPTHHWEASQMEVILAQAYAWAEQFSLSHI